VIAAIALWLAAAYRIRGHRPDGGVLRRIMHPVFTLRPLWAASCFGVVYTLTGDVWIAGAVAIGEWAGLHIRHAPGQDLGTWAGTVRDDVIAMAVVGTQRALVVGAALGAAWMAGLVASFPLAWVAMPIAYAITLPLSYYIGWRIPWRVPPLLRGGIEWSEFLTGASRALVFVVVFGA
jgi:hypothetical protein